MSRKIVAVVEEVVEVKEVQACAGGEDYAEAADRGDYGG